MPNLNIFRRFDLWSFGGHDCALLLEALVAHPAIGSGGDAMLVSHSELRSDAKGIISQLRALHHQTLMILHCKWSGTATRQGSAELKIDWATGTVNFAASQVASNRHVHELTEILNSVPVVNRKYLDDIQAHASALAALQTQLQEHARATALTLAEAQEALQKQRDLVAATTLTEHADIFAKDAERHQNSSSTWLVVALVSLAGVVGVAGEMWVNPAVDFPTVLGRLALLSVPVTALGASLRQYGAACHNTVLSTHRANALRSYDAFARVTQDNEARNAMLAHAIGLVFSVQDTGYSRVPGTSDSTSVFAELVKQIGSGKG